MQLIHILLYKIKYTYFIVRKKHLLHLEEIVRESNGWLIVFYVSNHN